MAGVAMSWMCGWTLAGSQGDERGTIEHDENTQKERERDTDGLTSALQMSCSQGESFLSPLPGRQKRQCAIKNEAKHSELALAPAALSDDSSAHRATRQQLDSQLLHHPLLPHPLAITPVHVLPH